VNAALMTRADHSGTTAPDGGAEALFLPPWDRFDDAALLAHYRGPRAVRFEPVIDPEEVRPERIGALMRGRFEFNGETHALPDPVEWLRNPSADIEWHILLHKFYYAVGLAQAWQHSGDAAYVHRWVRLVDGWMRVTPPGFIAADVTGRRVQNWIYSLHGLVMHSRAGLTAPIDAALFGRLLRSIHQQVEFLCANLTPKRNHRTLELLAIMLAGVVFPEFRRADHWREFALRETQANIAADLLADGVHCELSTDYHHLALRNWMQVRALAANNGVAIPPAMDRSLERAFEFSLQVHQPDGTVPSFSDGDARSYLALLAQGAATFGREDMRYVATLGRQGRPPTQRNAHFEASGYHVLRSGWAAPVRRGDAQHLVLDCGPLGEGNHGHFDALSFELYAQGRPLVVDPGRYTYSEAPGADDGRNWRVHFRGTAAHNTVEVDGRSQTRYAPKPIKEPSRHAHGTVRHRISGPAPETALIESTSGAVLDLLHGRCASHDYDAVHERCLVFVDRRYWIVSDWLRAPSAHDYLLNFQLGSQAQDQSTLSTTAGIRLDSPGLVIAQATRPGQVVRLAEGWVSRLYGHKLPAPALQTRAHGRDVDFDSVLVPCGDDAPPLQVTLCEAQGDDGDVAQALRIRLTLDGALLDDGWFHARGSGLSHWRIGDLEFSGRWLHWRADAQGRVLRAVSHAGATLRAGGDEVALTVGDGA